MRRLRHLLPGAVMLAGNAGIINTIALGFFRTPVSHMTGAVSRLGLDAAASEWGDAVTSSAIIGGFIAGAAVTGMVVGAWKLIPGRSYGVALMIEGALLALAALLLAYGWKASLPVVAMACGVQNAMTSSYCGLMIRTTHVTGTATDIGVMLGHWIRHGQIDLWKLRFLVALLAAFTAGGFLGAIFDRRFGPMVLAVPAAGCSISGALFWFAYHRGLADLVQNAAGPDLPKTGSFPRF